MEGYTVGKVKYHEKRVMIELIKVTKLEKGEIKDRKWLIFECSDTHPRASMYLDGILMWDTRYN